MGYYRSLFSVTVEQEYFADKVGNGLEFSPTAETQGLLEQNQLLIRCGRNDLSVFHSSDFVVPSGEAGRDEGYKFRFFVYAKDLNFPLYTAGLDKENRMPVYFSSEATIEGGGGLKSLPLPEDCLEILSRRRSGTSLANKKNLTKPSFIVDIYISKAALLEASAGRQVVGGLNYLIALGAEKIHWKYFFYGEYANKSIEISDLSSGASGVEFELSEMPVAKAGVAWVSKVAIAMQEVPAQRFQLREKEEAGKVLIKRLPNAGISNIGKEKLRDGRVVKVAEIYINQ